jgi:hypothetical protein
MSMSLVNNGKHREPKEVKSLGDTRYLNFIPTMILLEDICVTSHLAKQGVEERSYGSAAK